MIVGPPVRQVTKIAFVWTGLAQHVRRATEVGRNATEWQLAGRSTHLTQRPSHRCGERTKQRSDAAGSRTPISAFGHRRLTVDQARERLEITAVAAEELVAAVSRQRDRDVLPCELTDEVRRNL